MAGTLFVVSAPSGAGKTTLVQALLQRVPELRLSVSHTTRPPRPGEVHGQHYHFISEDEFRRMIDEGAFLEWAVVHDHYYGTALAGVEAVLKGGADLVLEIDWQGAMQVRQKWPEAVMIFILPPSRAELERRLRQRGTESEAVIVKRLRNASEEMRHAPFYDYIVVNRVLAEALEDLAAIVRAQRCRAKRQLERYPETLV